jgi:hypothetical protein
MQPIIAIDPGPEQSAYVLYDGAKTTDSGIMPNADVLELLDAMSTRVRADRLAIEGIACYGMPVGKETFDTCIWIGRFMQVFGPEETTLVYRKDVKMHLCQSMRAKDPMVRQALLDKFGPGKERAVGTKKNPGPLYGIKSHCWSALAVAVTYWDNAKEPQP